MQTFLTFILTLMPVFSFAASDTTFADLWNSAEPEATLERELQEVIWRYNRTQYEVYRFDAELDRRLSQGREGLLASPVYQKLIGLRILRHEQEEKLVEWVEELRNLSRDSSRPQEDRERAGNLINRFYNHILSREHSLDRLALQDLAAELQDEHFNEFAFESAEAIEAFLAESDPETGLPRREALQRKAAEAFAATRPEFEREVEELGSGWRELMNSTTQQSRYFPSTGSNGTISGYDFPRGNWALTFDDGPSSKYTPVILGQLRQYKIPVTFFWLAENAKAGAAAIQTAKDDGHLFGVHSYTHPDLTKAGINLNREITEATKVLASYYGYWPSYFRCPYGSCIFSKRATKAAVRKKIAAEKMLHVLWNVDSLDWQDRDPKPIYNRTVKAMKLEKRGIILYHDIHAQSAAASQMLFRDHIAPQGSAIKMRTISDLVAELNGGVASW